MRQLEDLVRYEPANSSLAFRERGYDPDERATLLRDVVNYGTATRALSLGRKDLAGKTGTTNENVDAWFCGYTPSLVGIAWIGFDQPRTLGTNETGAVAALPIWIAFMQRALKGVPEKPIEKPDRIVVAGPVTVASAIS